MKKNYFVPGSQEHFRIVCADIELVRVPGSMPERTVIGDDTAEVNLQKFFTEL